LLNVVIVGAEEEEDDAVPLPDDADAKVVGGVEVDDTDDVADKFNPPINDGEF